MTGDTHLPAALLLVYRRRDDTEELGLTLYKASLSAARHSFKKPFIAETSHSRTGKQPTNLDIAIHHERGRTILWFLFEIHVRINAAHARSAR